MKAKLEEKIWRGEDIYIAYKNYVLYIAEGSGEQMDASDFEEGYVDNFDLELYKKEEYEKGESCPNTIGGGIMLTEFFIETLYGKTVKEVVDEVFNINGQMDLCDLYVDHRPNYTVLQVG